MLAPSLVKVLNDIEVHTAAAAFAAPGSEDVVARVDALDAARELLHIKSMDHACSRCAHAVFGASWSSLPVPDPGKRPAPHAPPAAAPAWAFFLLACKGPPRLAEPGDGIAGRADPGSDLFFCSEETQEVKP